MDGKKFSWLNFFKGIGLFITIFYGIISIIMFFTGKNSFPELMGRGRRKEPVAELRFDSTGRHEKETVQVVIRDTVKMTEPSKTEVPKPVKISQVKKKPASKPESSGVSKGDGFFITFFKTPLVIIVLSLSVFGLIFTAIYDGFLNLFQNFDRGFPVVRQVYDWSFGDILGTWYAEHAVGWHMLVSFVVWIIIMSANDNK